MNGNWSRNAFVYLLIVVAGAAVFYNIYRPSEEPEQVKLSQLVESIAAGHVEEIAVRDEEVRVTTDEAEEPLITRRENGIPITETLLSLGVTPDQLANIKIIYESPSNSSNWVFDTAPTFCVTTSPSR